MGLLDIIFGLFFFTQTLTWPAARRGIPRRGVFFVVVYVIFIKMVINCQKMRFVNQILFKNDDIWSDLII